MVSEACVVTMVWNYFSAEKWEVLNLIMILIRKYYPASDGGKNGANYYLLIWNIFLTPGFPANGASPHETRLLC